MAETRQGTYAQAVKSHPKSYASNSNKQRSDKLESSSLNQLAQRNVDSDGFIGVNRRWKRTKKYFLCGIRESVNEGQIRSYLKEKKVTPTYISLYFGVDARDFVLLKFISPRVSTSASRWPLAKVR